MVDGSITMKLDVVLALHLLGMVMWMAGLFAAQLALAAGASRQLPAEPDGHAPDAAEDHARWARRALRRLAHPGAAVTVVFGVVLIGLHPQWMRQGWLHVKLLLVVLLIVLDLVMTVRTGRAGRNPIEAGSVRRWHAFTWLLLAGIVFLAVLKPF